jgi:Domain of unknown function (DUF4166)
MPPHAERSPEALNPSATASLLAIHQPNAPCGLYARLLGSSWLQVAEQVRAVHATQPTVYASGRLRISHGRGHIARVLARVLRLPRATDAADTRLVVTSLGDGEQWLRAFDDRRLDTRQYVSGDGELAERIGILEFTFRVEASDGGILFRQLNAALLWGSLRLRLPTTWAPRVVAREDPAGVNQIHVQVHVELPAVGRVLTYDGTIEIEKAHA